MYPFQRAENDSDSFFGLFFIKYHVSPFLPVSQSQQVSNRHSQPCSSHLHHLCVLWGSCPNPETAPDPFAGGAMSHIFEVGSAALRKKKKRTEPKQQRVTSFGSFKLVQGLSDSLGHAEVRRGLSYFPLLFK